MIYGIMNLFRTIHTSGETTQRDELIAYCVELPRLESPFSILKDFQTVRLLLIIRPRIDFSVIFLLLINWNSSFGVFLKKER